MIRIVDYGLGNIQAFLTMYKRLGVQASRARTPDDLLDASKIILPGVGSFDHAMELLNSSGMREVLENLVLQKQVPILGICVGMQILANSSEEGVSEGLGWINGHVKSFGSNPSSKNLPLPHMGWNDVSPHNHATLFKGFSDDARFYFLHSFYFECTDNSNVLASSDYGLGFDCTVFKKNIFGVQFHPEKSHHWGAQLLKNFSEIECA